MMIYHIFSIDFKDVHQIYVNICKDLLVDAVAESHGLPSRTSSAQSRLAVPREPCLYLKFCNNNY